VRALILPALDVASFVIQMIDANRPEIVTNSGQPKPVGGEQAAYALQLGNSSRHTTTSDAKVRGAIEASPLVPYGAMLVFTRQRP
jgi:hypothetical protein